MSARPRVVIAGLGDIGTLTAIHLSRHADLVGISSKPGVVSGQELGVRLARPEDWARDNKIAFDRFRRLDRVRRVHGSLVGADLDARHVTVCHADGTTTREPYEVLVIATGVTNGFWRTADLRSRSEIDADIDTHHRLVATARSLAVIGGGATAVSVAANARIRWPAKQVDLYFPGDRALTRHHPRAWERVRERLVRLGVDLHPGHRAVVPDGFTCDEITADSVAWATGQPPVTADAVVWALGRVRPTRLASR